MTHYIGQPCSSAPMGAVGRIDEVDCPDCLLLLNARVRPGVPPHICSFGVRYRSSETDTHYTSACALCGAEEVRNVKVG